MFRSNIALALFFACTVANGTGYVHKSNSAGGIIELSDQPASPELLKIVPECNGAFYAKNSVPDKMNIYGCWFPDHNGMVTVKWFDPYDGIVTYTYDRRDFHK